MTRCISPLRKPPINEEEVVQANLGLATSNRRTASASWERDPRGATKRAADPPIAAGTSKNHIIDRGTSIARAAGIKEEVPTAALGLTSSTLIEEGMAETEAIPTIEEEASSIDNSISLSSITLTGLKAASISNSSLSSKSTTTFTPITTTIISRIKGLRAILRPIINILLSNSSISSTTLTLITNQTKVSWLSPRPPKDPASSATFSIS